MVLFPLLSLNSPQLQGLTLASWTTTRGYSQTKLSNNSGPIYLKFWGGWHLNAGSTYQGQIDQKSSAHLKKFCKEAIPFFCMRADHIISKSPAPFKNEKV